MLQRQSMDRIRYFTVKSQNSSSKTKYCNISLIVFLTTALKKTNNYLTQIDSVFTFISGANMIEIVVLLYISKVLCHRIVFKAPKLPNTQWTRTMVLV